MFCDRCGSGLDGNQRFCSSCGKQAMAAVAASANPPAYASTDHVKLLGVLWLALSAMEVIGGLVIVLVGNTVLAHLPDGPQTEFMPFVHLIVSAVGIFVLAKALVGFLAGWGLLQHEPWARMLTIVLACFALLHFPFGTALGIYSLWALLPADAAKAYDQRAASMRAT
jgi:hypothetical protein